VNLSKLSRVRGPVLSIRRWSSRTFPYGYLVTTSPQSLVAPSATSSCEG